MKNKPVALITGITGQDGSYLAEFLLHKGYTVYGIVRRSSSQELSLHRIRHLLDKIYLFEGDITDSMFVTKVLATYTPNEIYNLAAQSHVHTSFYNPDYTIRTNTLGLLNILEGSTKPMKVYQASTSEMFGGQDDVAYGEWSEFNPRSPYAVSKVAAHQLAEMYRDIDRFVSCGILFNHESPRRGDNFVTKKIAVAAAKAYLNIPYNLELGNLDAARDWGFAPDYVEAMWSMLQQDRPDSFVIGTGHSITVEQFLDLASSYINKTIKYSISDDFKRPLEVDCLQSDPSYAEAKLGWKAKTSISMLVKIMVDAEIERLMPDAYDGDGHNYFKKNYGRIYRWL